MVNQYQSTSISCKSVHEIANKSALGNSAISKLDQAMQSAILELRDKAITESEALLLYADLQRIKAIPVKEGVDPSSFSAIIRKVNLLQNLISPPAPESVREHPNYYDVLYRVSPHKLDYAERMVSKVIEKLSEAASNPAHQGKFLYLLRESSSAHGCENLRVFTLSFASTNPTFIQHTRLAYNNSTNAWQLAGKTENEMMIYDKEGEMSLQQWFKEIDLSNYKGEIPENSTQEHIPNRFKTLNGLIHFFFYFKFQCKPEDLVPVTTDPLPSEYTE